MKFKKEKIVVDNNPRIFYRPEEAGDSLTSFEVVASREGIAISGRDPLLIRDMDDLQDLAKLMADAWSDHMRLVPRIVRPGE